MPVWSEWWFKLAQARRGLGLTQAQAARRIGISDASLRSYEVGRRRPSRERLVTILDALGIPSQLRNDILSTAGYASTPRSQASELPRYLDMDAAVEAVAERPWPALVVNERLEILAANPLFRTLWNIDEDRLRSPVERNALAMTTDAAIAPRSLNWDTAVARLIALFKAADNLAEAEDAPSAYFAAVLDRVSRGERTFVKRFWDLWEKTDGANLTSVTWTYPIAWEMPGIGSMRFQCVVNSINEVDCLDIDDWIPIDGASRELVSSLAAIVGRRAPVGTKQV